MPAFTVTTTPQRLYHSSYGGAQNPDQIGIQVANGVTGTVSVAPNSASCVDGSTNYITENTAALSLTLTAGQEVWVVCGSGTVNIVYNCWGAGH